MTKTFGKNATRLLAGSATLALSLGALATPAHAVVPNENQTPEEIEDTENEFAGVGQFYRADGFICTGTLINPRTVLFAAHCVNDVPAQFYNDQQLPAAFSFNQNALPGFINWINNGFSSNPDVGVFNINRIYWDPRSVQRPVAQGFLEADVALASLDTPAAGIPTWAMLFSPLPNPDPIDLQDGTGYHVDIVGYGNTGNAFQGDINSGQFRRRAAENMLGSLASFNDRNLFLFGSSSPLTQVLYSLDFDSPTRTDGDPDTPPRTYDFNLFKDDAREREGTTGGGDSGGPLILDAENNAITDENLIIGVLSGGSRFFGGQPFSSYGTQSFSQPLFLYWDWIVANSPYRYVSAVAGDGNWEDENHWVVDLDPMFRIIDDNGNVVNGLPTSPGDGIDGDAPKFGQICFEQFAADDSRVSSECQDLETGQIFVDDQPVPPPPDNEPQVTNGRGTADLGELTAVQLDDGEAAGDADGSEARQGLLGAIRGGLVAEEVAINGKADLIVEDVAISGDANLSVEDVAINGKADLADTAVTPAGINGGAPEYEDEPLPAPTLANGLPGATGFVPDNVDGDIVNGVEPRYFDVTLSQMGRTTLNSEVTIDRLTVAGMAGLDIVEDASLTSLIDVTQMGGMVNVDGSLTSVGDYSLITGILTGDGTVTAPFLTNIAGAIAPGSMGEIGTLTIDGNFVSSSGSALLIDLGEDGTSDTLAITGDANLGGQVGIALANLADLDVNEVAANTYTIVTIDGEYEGMFDAQQLSAILAQNFIYTDNAVLLEIEIGSYADVVNADDPNQLAFARLLDAERGSDALAALYELDFLDGATIRAALSALSPTTENGVYTLTAQTFTNTFQANDERLKYANRDNDGGTLAMVGNPAGVAQSFAAGLGGQGNLPLRLAQVEGADANATSMVREGFVPSDMAVYVSGGFIDGDAAPTPFSGTDRDQYDGWFAGGGVEKFFGTESLVGISGYYTEMDSDVSLGNQVDLSAASISVYGRAKSGGFVADGQIGVTFFDLETERVVSFLGGNQTLQSDSNGTGIHAQFGVGYEIPVALGYLTPGLDLRYANLDLGEVSESGGPAALVIDRAEYDSVQGRAGFDFRTPDSSALQFGLEFHAVHEFEEGPQVYNAGFVGGTGARAGFVIAPADRDWIELGTSVGYDVGNVRIGASFDTTLERENANAQIYRATATIRF